MNLDDEKRDRELGMGRKITRRDFLNGVTLGTGASLVGGALRAEQFLTAAAFDDFAPIVFEFFVFSHHTAVLAPKSNAQLKHQKAKRFVLAPKSNGSKSFRPQT